MAKIKNDSKFKEEVGEELADIINDCLQFSNSTEIDIASIVRDKLEKSDKKYPVDKAKGIATKYN